MQIRCCVLAHINADFIKHGPIDPHEFFTLEDVINRVSALSRSDVLPAQASVAYNAPFELGRLDECLRGDARTPALAEENPAANR